LNPTASVPGGAFQRFFTPDLGERPVFVVGYGRSGTTMLRLMLNRHPELAILSETDFAKRVWERRWALSLARDPYRAFQQLLDRFICDIRESPERDDFKLDFDAYRQAVLSQPPALNNFISVLGTIWKEQHGKARWGEKDPNHTRYLRLLHRMFPNMKAVHIVRDPRDVAASFVHSEMGAPTDPLVHALLWSDSNNAVADLPPDTASQVLSVRYEDLTERTADVLTGVCHHLGIPYVSSMLHFHHDAQRFAPDRLQPWMRRLGRPLDGTSVGRWHADLPATDAAIIESVLQPQMQHYGYAPTPRSETRHHDSATLQRVLRARALATEENLSRPGVLLDHESHQCQLADH
jgi:hypothetical protein